MPKGEIVPCTKEEMDSLMETTLENDFYYMLFLTAKTTGRRLGELFGNQKKKEIGRKVIGYKTEYDRDGNAIALSRTRAVYKKIPGEFEGGVKVKDIDFEKHTMKVWVLKRRKFEQDETILIPDVVKVMKHYIIKHRLSPEDYLFRKVSYRGIQQAIKRYAKKAGIKHTVSFHNFRHHFITELKRKGYTNDMIAKLTGHKAISSLTTYDHVLAVDLKDQVMNDLRDI